MVITFGYSSSKGEPFHAWVRSRMTQC